MIRCLRYLLPLLAGLACHVALALPAQPDTAFGSGGLALRLRGAGDSNASAVAIAEQRDGRIVVAGWCQPNGANVPRLCVYRLLANGAADPAFAGGGVLTTTLDIEWYSSAWVLAQVAVQRSGKIVLATTCRGGDLIARFCLLRLNADGSIDGSFGSGGSASLLIGAASAVNAMVLDASERIVLAGTCDSGVGNVAFCLARYGADGTLDTSFGSGGIQQLLPSNAANANDMALAMAIDSGGRILVAGRCSTLAIGERFCIVQFDGNGQLRNAFGNAGVVFLSPGSGVIGRVARAIAVQADERIVVAGHCGAAFCLLRLFADGTLDTSFDGGYGASGMSFPVFPGATSSWLTALAVHGDGRLLAAGNCNATAAQQFCLQRLWPEGYADSSFGSAGHVEIGSMAAGNPLVLQDARVTADGAILLAGQCRTAADNSGHSCVLRLQGGPNTFSACSLDVDGDGVVQPQSDGVLLLRAMLGLRSTHLPAGIAFAPAARRTTAAALRDYLSLQCGIAVRPD